MLKVIERKTQKEGLAWPLDEGRYAVDLGEGNVRELANSTFRRLFTVLGEAQQEQVNQVQQNQEHMQPENSEQVELEALLEGSEIIEDGNTSESAPKANESVEPDELHAKQEKKQEKKQDEKPKRKTVEDLGLNIELLDWKMNATRSGKTDKVVSIIKINDYIMEITEYAGYITDVRVFKHDDQSADADPNTGLVEVYRSPKMSLRDTLVWLGLSEDDMKIARREITNIRRQVKAAHLEQLEEQKEWQEVN